MTRLDRRRDLAGYLEHFRARVLQDALDQATEAYWLHRAAEWEWVIHGGPQPPINPPLGMPTPYQPPYPKPRSEWTARDWERQQIADACRHRASLAFFRADHAPEIDPDIWQALADAATPACCEHCTRHADQPRRAA